jgi:hypothetical protein
VFNSSTTTNLFEEIEDKFWNLRGKWLSDMDNNLLEAYFYMLLILGPLLVKAQQDSLKTRPFHQFFVGCQNDSLLILIGCFLYRLSHSQEESNAIAEETISSASTIFSSNGTSLS